LDTLIVRSAVTRSRRQTTEQIADRVMELPTGSRIMILAPVVRDRKGEHHDILIDARKAGFVRARVDGNLYELTERISLEKNKKHNIEIVVDRLVIEAESISRLRESVETAAKMANGLVLIVPADGKGEELLFSQNFACPYDGFSMEELAPRNFSFNNPHGACPACTGLGSKLEIDPDLVIPDKTRSLSDGAIRTWGRSSYFYNDLVEAVALRYKIPMDRPFAKLTVKERQIILHGNNGDPLRVKYFNSEGKRRWYETSLRGDRAEPGTAPPRDRVGIYSRRDRAHDEPAPVPGVQRQETQARVPGRHLEWPVDHRCL